MRETLEAIDEPVIATLLDFWKAARRAGQSMPSRRQIDPVDMPRLLPHIALMEVLPADPWFRCRVAGAEVERRFGKSLRGASLHDFSVPPEGEDVIADQYRACIRERRPVYDHQRFLDEVGKPLHYHRLALPLAEGDGTITHLLMGYRFRPWVSAGTDPLFG